MTDTFWHPEDKAWMAQRKAEWPQVKQVLDVISTNYPPLKRKYHKYHKELFFFGTVNPECMNPLLKDLGDEGMYATGHDIFDYALPLFRIWYHPAPEQMDFDAVLSSYIRCGSVERLREKLFITFFGSGVHTDCRMFSPADGMMNGREALCVKLLCPGLDYQTLVFETGDPQYDTLSTQSACPAPSIVEQWVRQGAYLELKMDAQFVPYAPGQYLWDHFSYNMEHYPEKSFTTRGSSLTYDDKKRVYMELIAEILAFEQRTDASRNRPSTIAMVESLIGKYEQKTFSDAMLALWDETKRNFNVLQEKRKYIVCYRDQEWLEEDGMSIEKQQARVSQWKQV